MPDLLPDYPRLHALLGDAVRDLPDALAEKMEDALCEAAESIPRSAFLTFLDRHGKQLRADGEPWAETRLTPGRAFDLALATRSASGITALSALLHAAHVARENDDPGSYPSAALVDGLFDACEALSLQVGRCLVP